MQYDEGYCDESDRHWRHCFHCDGQWDYFENDDDGDCDEELLVITAKRVMVKVMIGIGSD